MSLQQTTFENTVTKGEIAHEGQFPLHSQYFQLYSTLILTCIEMFCNFTKMYSESSAADLLYVGKV